MALLKQALGGLAFAVVGAGILLVLQSDGLVHFRFLDVHQYGVPSGDPPVTVSDGSLHVHSTYDWFPDVGKTIMPRGAGGSSGSLHNGCGMDNDTSAAKLWTDTQDYPVDPGATVTITHDPDSNAPQDVANAAVTIQVPQMGANGLSIQTATGRFAQAASGLRGRNNRQHSRTGEVSSIQISSSGGRGASGWAPSNAHNPHFTLGFCFN